MIRFKPVDLSNFYNERCEGFLQKTELFFFLRKHKLFNKGRYSRNRQTYRTGVYWCLWVNIIAVAGFYYWFYRFSMNFGYLWPFFSLFFVSFFIPRALKYNYVGFVNLTQSLWKLGTWFFLIFFDTIFNSRIAATFLGKFKINTVWAPIYYLNYTCDLFIKTYSHWNYFLPLSWIHRAHRKFFYKRVLYICFS